MAFSFSLSDLLFPPFIAEYDHHIITQEIAEILASL
jgi:hypothetical protein